MSHTHEGASDFLTPGDMTMLVGSVQLAGGALCKMFAAAESKRPDEAMTAYEAFLAGHRLYTEFVRKKWGIDVRDERRNDRHYCEDPSDSFGTVGARNHVSQPTDSGNYWRNICARSLLRPLGYGWDPDFDARSVPSLRHPVAAEMLTDKPFWQAVGAPPGQQLLRVLPGYRMLKYGPTPHGYPVTIDANSVTQDIDVPVVRLIHPDTGEPYFIARGGDHEGIENTILGASMVYDGSVHIPTSLVPVGGRVFDRDGTIISGWEDEQKKIDNSLRKAADETPILLWTRNPSDREQGYRGTSREFAKRGVIFRSGFDFGNWPLCNYPDLVPNGQPLVDARRVDLLRSQLGTLFPDPKDHLYAERALDVVVSHHLKSAGDRQTALETKPPVIAAMIASLPLSPRERKGMLYSGVVYNDSRHAIWAGIGTGSDTVMVKSADSLARGMDFRPRVRTDQ